MSFLEESSPDWNVREIGRIEDLEPLREEWSELWAKSREHTIFQHPEWVLTWWQHFACGRLFVLAVRQGSILAGLAPFHIRENASNGTRETLLIGTGITAYLDILALPSKEIQVADAVFEYLLSRANLWDSIDLQQLRLISPLLRSGRRQRLKGTAAVQEVCPVLALTKDARGSAIVPPHMRHKLDFYRRRLRRAAGITMEVADSRSFEEFFAALLRLHRSRWLSREEPAIFNDPAVQAFHRQAAEGLLSAGFLRMYGLRIQGSIQAVLYALNDGTRAYYFLSASSPELAWLSLGTIMVGHGIDEALAEGATEFDFLRGREAYKYLWGSKGRLNYRFRGSADTRPVDFDRTTTLPEPQKEAA